MLCVQLYLGALGIQIQVLTPASPTELPSGPPKGTLYFIMARPRASSLLMPLSSTLSLSAPNATA